MYNEADILFGKLNFDARLDRKKDARRPNDLSHVVIKCDWSLFLKKTGVRLGDEIKLELIKGKSVGAAVQFRVR